MNPCNSVLRVLILACALWARNPRADCLLHTAFVPHLDASLPRRCGRYLGSTASGELSSSPPAGNPAGMGKKKNLLKHQFDDYADVGASTAIKKDEERWQDIVMEEIAKNRNVEPSDNFLFGEYNADEYVLGKTTNNVSAMRKPSYNYRLSPEGRVKLENRIIHLTRMAATNPGTPKAVRPKLWIVRPSCGNYCELLERDDERLRSFVKRVRKHFPKERLEILKVKIDVKMPLCEVFFEGDITDMVRIFYARGGTLQFYVVPRFWSRCPLLEKDPRLEAKYGKSTAPGLFPQWDEDGMLEELMDCMDVRPDYALEFRLPNAWQLLPMVPEHDRALMVSLFEKVHWPTRLRVQNAFEQGVEDYRDVISDEYAELQRLDRGRSNILDYWL